VNAEQQCVVGVLCDTFVVGAENTREIVSAQKQSLGRVQLTNIYPRL
jgi:hypothetical protein